MSINKKSSKRRFEIWGVLRRWVGQNKEESQTARTKTPDMHKYLCAHAQPATRPSWIYIMACARAIDRASIIARASKAASAWSANTRKDGVWRGKLGGGNIAFARVRT